MTGVMQRIEMDCRALYTVFGGQGKVPADKLPVVPSVFGVQQAQQVAGSFDALVQLMGKGAKRKSVLPVLEDWHRKIVSSIGYYQATKAKYDRQVFAGLGAAVVALKAIPSKISPVIRSITNSIKVSGYSGHPDQRALTGLSVGRRRSRIASSLGQYHRISDRPVLLAAIASQDESFRQAREELVHIPLSRRVAYSDIRVQ